jgi:hypothetical protein
MKLGDGGATAPPTPKLRDLAKLIYIGKNENEHIFISIDKSYFQFLIVINGFSCASLQNLHFCQIKFSPPIFV